MADICEDKLVELIKDNVNSSSMDPYLKRMISSNDDKLLEMLKISLPITTSSLDSYLKGLIASAKDAISTEGITLIPNDESCDMMIIMYADHLYRAKNDASKPFPRHLRFMMNNKLMAQKARGISDDYGCVFDT